MALSNEHLLEDEMEHETALEGEEFLGAIGNVVGSLLGETGEHEDELGEIGEFEDELGEIGEFEDELGEIGELEGGLGEIGEFEDELGEIGELEGGLGEIGEFEDELGEIGEFEDELGEIGEFESELGESGEQFFGRLKRIARGVGRFVKKNGPMLKGLARRFAPIVGGAIGGPLGAKLAGAATRLLREQELGEFEMGEFELGEHEMMPQSMHEANGELMAAVASRTSSEIEAEAMIGAAASTMVSPRDTRALRRALPHMVRGTAVLTRLLRQRSVTRPVVRAIPTIVRRTRAILKRCAAKGRPINRKLIGRVMSSQVRQVLSNPRTTTRAILNNVRGTSAARRGGSTRRRRSSSL